MASNNIADLADSIRDLTYAEIYEVARGISDTLEIRGIHVSPLSLADALDTWAGNRPEGEGESA